MRNFSLLFCAVFVGSAFADAYKVPPDEPLAVIQIPDKWKTKEIGESIAATSPNGAVHVLALPVERNKVADSMGEAMRYIRNTGGITVKADSIKQEAKQLNGMELRDISWDAKDKDGEVKIRFHVITVAEKKPFIVAFWCSPEAQKKHEGDLAKILQSIKKA